MTSISTKERPNKIRVAAVQQFSYSDKGQSLEHTKSKIEEAVREGVDLVCLQELHATQYFCQTENTDLFDLAEPLKGQTFEFLSELAKRHNIVIVGSIFERRAAGIYHNTAIVLETDGSLAGYYRKMHIPDDPGFYEKFYFTPGDHHRKSCDKDGAGFEPINTSIGRLGVLVCWDQWYPEAARLMALKGADLLIYPTAIGWDRNDTEDEQERQKDAWITVQRGHSVANNIPVVSINRVGHEEDPSNQTSGIDFWGRSFITGPQGEFLSFANHQHEEVLLTTIDMDKTESVRRIWPYFRDRRIDAYERLTDRFIDS